MYDNKLRNHSLVIYKSRPARVMSIDEKIEIELDGNKTKRVREKDIALLHPGPLGTLSDLVPQSGDVLEAWELLGEYTTDIAELTELIFSEYTPPTAWATWDLVRDGVYFSGSPKAIKARSTEQVEQTRQERQAKEQAELKRSDFLQRMQSGELIADDRKQLSEVEMLALAKRDKSRVLQELGVQQSPEAAHRLLVRLGYWDAYHNPHPARCGVNTEIPVTRLGPLLEEGRKDLTQLPAFAIDDEGNQDPDDAISLDGDRIWVHVADVAALVRSDSEADSEARVRGANLYIPERTVPMLPLEVTDRLGLGLDETSSALSIGFSVTDTGAVVDIEITPSRVRVDRMSYAEANRRLDEPLFQQLAKIAQRSRQRRNQAGASAINLPEVSLRVKDGEVLVRPVSRTGSREMVTDAMLLAGEAVACFAIEHGIPIPFVTQPPPDKLEQPRDMASMFAYRKCLRPSRLSTQPEPHAGLGLEAYTRVTSPLRRYSDLLVHQQLRAWFAGAQLLSEQEVTARIGVASVGAGKIRKAERLANRHWTLVYLMQHPQWQGSGMLVEVEGPRGTVIVSELGYEAKIRLREDSPLNVEKKLMLREVDLPDSTAFFQVRN